VAVWQHYPLLEEVAFTRQRLSGIALKSRERRASRNDHHCGRCGETHILHDILQVSGDPGATTGRSAVSARVPTIDDGIVQRTNN
jgi:hypothetical protein